MHTKPGLTVYSATLAGVMALFVTGCNKPADTTVFPVPSTTIGTKVDDSIVTTKVKAALLADPTIKSLDIMVVTRNDEVHVSGFVDNQDQMDRVLSVAHSIEGVKNVSNDMSIKK